MLRARVRKSHPRLSQQEVTYFRAIEQNIPSIREAAKVFMSHTPFARQPAPKQPAALPRRCPADIPQHRPFDAPRHAPADDSRSRDTSCVCLREDILRAFDTVDCYFFDHVLMTSFIRMLLTFFTLCCYFISRAIAAQSRSRVSFCRRRRAARCPARPALPPCRQHTTLICLAMLR